MEEYLKDTYIKLTPREHILKRPGMYISSTDFKLKNLFIFDNNFIINKEIMYNEGLYKIIDEIITNVIDQTIKDSSLSLIYAKINTDSIIIFNNGLGVDVAIHPTYKIYIPQLIFSELLSSTNYNDDIGKVVGGTYGIGIKLSVIFSKKFEIKIWDSKRKLYYHQIYENNLSKISKPIIKKYKHISDEDLNIDKKYLKNGGVKIIIYPDFERFNTLKFDEDMIYLIKRRLLDLIMITRKNINIIINNNNIDRGSNNIETYLNLFNLNNNNNWIIGHCIKNTNWQYAIRFYKNSNHINLTFVNGIYTNYGGTHLNYFIDLIFNRIKKITSPLLTKKILLENIIIFLNTSIINPTYSSQSKDELTTSIKNFGYECEIPESFFNDLKKSSLIEELKKIVSQTELKTLSKFDGSKKNKIKFIPKLEDANFAGTKKSSECTLILTEGDSAKSTALAGLSGLKEGRNYYGIYPLRGKLLNVRDASINQINNNKEVQDITKIMGLKLGTIYTEDNINQLRYGSIMLMCDADEDGSHIKGLIINYLDFFYPSLLLLPHFLKVLVTPLIRATYKQQLITFSNTREFDKWKINIKDFNLYKIKYYKGLGTSTSKEAIDYFKNIEANLIYLYNKKNTNNDLLLAFSKDKIEDRKKWLGKYDPNILLDITITKNISIKDFINNELIHFSNYDNIRSIPSMIDGLKISQRKIIYTTIKKNIINEIKVSQLASSVSEYTSYHHGEQSLINAIINMAQNYIGSNNLPLLVNSGQFGSRIDGGKDHAASRYIYTYLHKYVDKIFIKEDNDLLTFLVDEGLQIQPVVYLPIIPLILVNGTEGIGTGYSSYIPCYNPTDIINWLDNKLKGIKNTKKIIPFYKDFKGNIFEFDNNTFISEGLIEFHKNELHIIELPIKLWTNDYKLFLEELIYENKDSLFKSFLNQSSDVNIKFILKYNEENAKEINKMYNTFDSLKINNLYKYLSLYKTIKISNMHCYSCDNKIQKYNSPEEILNDFYNFRLPLFNERKKLILNKINENIKFISNQINFIKLVIKDKGKIYKIKNIDLFLEKNNFDKINNYNYLTNLTFNQLTQNNLNKLEDKLLNYNKEYKQILNKTDKELWINDLNNLKIALLI